MDKKLPFFNWSLNVALTTEPDSFTKARFRIIYTILLFSILKAVIVTSVSIINEQWLQFTRATVAIFMYTLLTKILLYRPSSLKPIAHIMVFAGIIIVWTNIFIYVHSINLVTLQFVFMVILSSFYTLGNRLGFTYSITAVLPVILFLVWGDGTNLYSANKPQELASPGYEIIVILNFLTIIVSHFLFFRAFHTNLLEKEQLNKQLQVAIAEANELAVSRSNFLSTMSHELRTPLNSVIGITELLIQDKPSEHQKENLKILQFSTIDLLSLINNILDFNKISSEKLELEKVPINLHEFIINRCAGLKLKADDKNLDFVVDIDKQLENVVVVTDPTRLSQIIYNLVSNAIKFTERGSITIKLTCLEKTNKAANIQFSVTDTGIGIPKERHESIFELFTQAESHITRKYGGTGLGLAIVKQVLALFGTQIRLESDTGKGSNFHFVLKLKTTSVHNDASVIHPIAETNFHNLRILIAEDNDVNRLLMKKQMETMKIDYTIVENGLAAYEACCENHYDIILMDLHMPEMDGYEAIKLIRTLPDAEKRNTYVVAFTASVTEQQKISDYGFNDYLYKPVSINELQSKLNKATAIKHKHLH